MANSNRERYVSCIQTAVTALRAAEVFAEEAGLYGESCDCGQLKFEVLQLVDDAIDGKRRQIVGQLELGPYAP